MVEMGKECGFPLNFDMPRPFSPRKTELPPIKSPNGLLYSREEAERRTHSGDEIVLYAFVLSTKWRYKIYHF